MQTKHLLRLLAGATLALSLVKVSGQTPAASSDAFPIFENYIKLSGQYDWASGDAAAFRARAKQPDNGSGGIGDFLFTKDVTKDTALRIDGHAIGGAEDYLAHFNVTKDKVGSVDVGYQSFRTFYDGVGGFFPTNGSFATITQTYPGIPQELFVDRSKLWAEATINLPNAPIFKIRYTNELRDGRKDSTEWGPTDLITGVINNATTTVSRMIVPSYLQLSERHQALEGSMKQTVGKTTYQLTALGDWTNNMDGRFIIKNPGEVKPFTAQTSTNSANYNNQVGQTTFDGIDTKTFSLTGTTVTILTDKVTMRAGLSYQDVAGTFSGSRQVITITPTATGVAGNSTVVAVPVSTPVTTYIDTGLAGTTGVNSFAASLAFDLKPTDDLSATVALKAEDKSTKGAGSYNVVAASGTPATTLTTTPRLENSHSHEKSLTPALDLRYTGIKDVALYASATGTYTGGRERNTPQYGSATISSPLQYFNNVSQSNKDFTVGATWHQSSLLSFRAETFYKDHSNGSDGYNTTANSPVLLLNNNYVLGSKFSGIKLTVIAKPIDTLSLTTRYIYQRGTMQVTSYQQAGLIVYGDETYDSMHSTSHSIAETVDWTPISQFYVQANANLVFNVIDTVYPRAGVASNGLNANGILQNSNNNYFTGSLLAGAVVTTTDDVQVQFTYYRANNGDAQLASLTLPYGVVATEYSASVGVKHKFSDKLIGNAKVGYFDSKNDTTGGNTNFHGPQAYVSLDYGF